MITYSDQNSFNPSNLMALFEQASWSNGRTLPDTQDMVKHTNLFLTAWDGERLVGCGRVLTDYVYRASIWDVIVDQQYQGQDIGTEIINRILSHETLQRVELFWLCTREHQTFYETLGFSSKEQTGMVWARNRLEFQRSNIA
jgi:N-acetylglutamate synthase-like GNAT family acetyltransferase